MKDYRYLCAAGLLAFSALLAACGGGDDGTPTPVNFSVIDTDLFSGIHTERFTVTRNSADWAALWTEHKRGTQVPLPAIDFSQNMAVGVFLGQRPSGCSAVAITAVLQAADKITVQYKETVPTPLQGCAAVLVFPSQIATVPASNLAVEFVAAN